MNSYLMFFIGVLSGWAFLALVFLVVRYFLFNKIVEIVQRRQMKKVTEQLKSGMPLADFKMPGGIPMEEPTDEQMEEAKKFFEGILGNVSKDMKFPGSEKD